MNVFLLTLLPSGVKLYNPRDKHTISCSLGVSAYSKNSAAAFLVPPCA